MHDSKMLEATVDAVPLVYSGRHGAPRCRPAKLHADKGYDYAACRRALRKRGIVPRIARRGVDSSERLGRWRWVVERTLALGGGANAGMAEPLPTAESTLRAAR